MTMEYLGDGLWSENKGSEVFLSDKGGKNILKLDNAVLSRFIEWLKDHEEIPFEYGICESCGEEL